MAASTTCRRASRYRALNAGSASHRSMVDSPMPTFLAASAIVDSVSSAASAASSSCACLLPWPAAIVTTLSRPLAKPARQRLPPQFGDLLPLRDHGVVLVGLL